MLDSLRHASKTWVVKLLLALLVLSFLAWGIDDVVRNGLFGRGPAISVGSVEITAEQVNSEFKREMDRLQPLFGGKLTSEEARKLGLVDRTIDTIVSRTLIDEAARQLGLTVSDDAVVAQVTADPSFRNAAGQFDPDLLRRALARVGISEKQFMQMEKGNLIRGQVAAALSGGPKAPAVLVDPLVRWREERRVAEVVTVADDSVPAPAAPDAAEQERYYQANAQRFMAPEFRTVTVLRLRPEDVAGDIEITEEMLQEGYQARLDEFVTRERRQVSQLVLGDEAAAAKAAEMVKAGKDLAAIAKEAKSSVVDLGAVEPADLPDELATLVFSLRSGATGGPVQTSLGWHVVKVGQVVAGRTRTLADARAQLERDLRRERALDRLSETANQLEDTLGGGATLEEAAARFNLKLARIPAVDAAGKDPKGKAVPDLPKTDSFLDVVFHTDQGTESQLTEIENDGFFLVRIDQVTPPQPRPLADIRNELIHFWSAERRHERAEAKARKLLDEVKEGQSLAKAAQAAGLTVRTTQPFTREGTETAKLPGAIVAGMFEGKPGAVAMAGTQGGWMVARLAKVVPFNPAAEGKTAEAAGQRVAAALAGDLIDQYIAALNADLGVMVDRSQITREE
ncbi:peptidyl-prolyl cis-trans isomerase [Magnetospirillum sp. UT-4]|uniref:peptidyl-prolyl cis-trans isomerase n=1 Tax=Magnetospirillum sp. UT-4 TaxID=2681467 RepID=UPI0013835CBC|nr:peptidyl-prolyl cis-trans isomerase [Magnetospirillum sp. UT-4]CAA7613472.1 Peptidyl-prolyl cis-trans isomerse D [Magnetospirillum sp. UT-4]